MPLIDSRGKLFGLVNLLDALIITSVVFAGVGVVAVKSGNSAIDKVVERKGPAEVVLMIRANIVDLNMFKAGEKAFITIRNTPYDNVLITKADAHRSQIAVPTNDGKAFRLTTDPSSPYSSEVILHLRDDNAMQTADGIVWGGQKMKVGVPVDVEGFKYRLRGSVLDVRMVGEAKR